MPFVGSPTSKATLRTPFFIVLAEDALQIMHQSGFVNTNYAKQKAKSNPPVQMAARNFCLIRRSLRFLLLV